MISKNTTYQNIEITFTNIVIIFCCYYINTHLDNTQALIWITPILVILNSLRYIIRKQIKHLVDFIIKWRWLIGLILFIILVTLRVHGSSMAAFNNFTGEEQVDDTGLVFGEPHEIRTDEYNVQVPYFFSQIYNDFNETSYQMSLSGQDMIIGYNSPVLDWTLIGKPFVWGYILFGNEIGISWYWCSKTILALLVAYEACFILTKNQYISLFGSILIIFSPAIQWWFSPHMFDVYFWCMSIFTVGYYFFTAQNRKWKIFTTVLAIAVVDGFVIALFPSLQVGVGYVVFALFLGSLYRDREKITFHKKDILRLLAAIVIIGAILGHFILTAKDAIQILSSTVYPGQRISTGGDKTFADLFTNLNALFTPYYAPGYSNECELAPFSHLGVLCILLFPYMYFACRKKINNEIKWYAIGGIFFVVTIAQIEFMIVGIPEWLAKITLLSYVNRMNLVYGFTACLFTIWTLSTIARYYKYFNIKILFLMVYIYGGLYCIATDDMVDPTYVKTLPGGLYFYIVLALLFAFAGYLMVLNKLRFFVALCSIWISLTSFTVNPIMVGISSITDRAFVKAAIACDDEDSENWLAIGGRYEQNLLLANGLKVLNAVNYYPDFEKWEALDPDGQYMDAYNRYAHICVYFTDQETTMESPFPDELDVYLNPEDLDKLNVKYILITESQKEILISSNIEYEMVYENKGYCIYKLY